jgi:hypothetical protein
MRATPIACGALTAALALALGAGQAAATQCNIDLTNTGSVPAYGVYIILPGAQTINPSTGIYSGGGGDDIFHHFTISMVGGNTEITWSNPSAPYAPNATAVQGHVGFTPSSGHCDIVSFDFTDQSGNPIPGVGLPFVEVHWQSGEIVVTNNFPYPVTIRNLRGGVFDPAPPLSGLNRFDSSLSGGLTSLGSDATISSGSYNVWHWPFPWPPCIECVNVAVFQIYASEAVGTVDFYVEAVQ